MTISSVSTITVYDCAASTSAEVVGTSSPASVVSNSRGFSFPHLAVAGVRLMSQ